MYEFEELRIDEFCARTKTDPFTRFPRAVKSQWVSIRGLLFDLSCLSICAGAIALNFLR